MAITKPRTAADFRATYDRNVIVPTKIKAGLAALLKIGKEHYATDEEFRSICGLQGAQLADFREQFKKHWFITPSISGSKTPKRVWFGDAKVAARLRPADEE
jgi:hypothetical protein